MANEVERDEAREERIEKEILIDAHSRKERAKGWHLYIEDEMEACESPLKTRCHAVSQNSPLKEGDEVKIVNLASLEKCHAANTILVKVALEGNKVVVPLSQLMPLDDVDEAMQQAIADWHYFVGRGYRF